MYNHKWCKDNFGVGGILAYLLPSFNIVLVSVSFVGEFHYLLYILPTRQTKLINIKSKSKHGKCNFFELSHIYYNIFTETSCL